MIRRAAAAVLALLFVFLVRPEIARYRAERELGVSNAAFDLVLSNSTQVQNATEVLPRVGDRAAAAASALPADSRPLVLAGSCQLVAGHADRALAFYERALATGERAEIHLNLGRAEALLSDLPAAQAAFVRSIWISPALLRAVPPGFQADVSATVTRLEEDLRNGKLRSPPPIPPLPLVPEAAIRPSHS
jgi:tetratricopeptide (TPR) repeat protein